MTLVTFVLIRLHVGRPSSAQPILYMYLSLLPSHHLSITRESVPSHGLLVVCTVAYIVLCLDVVCGHQFFVLLLPPHPHALMH